MLYLSNTISCPAWCYSKKAEQLYSNCPQCLLCHAMSCHTILHITSRHVLSCRRNNLYWCYSLETPVLWMGTSSNEPNVYIDVLAITRTLPTEVKDKDEETDKNKDKKDSKDISQSSASSSSSSFSASQPIKQKGNSAASVSPTPPVPLNGLPPIQCPNRRTVARNSLRPMDDDILLLYKDAVGRELVGALLDFAEWDDHARQSYMWPAFIINILG